MRDHELIAILIFLGIITFLCVGAILEISK
jgi:hypothetical protein